MNDSIRVPLIRPDWPAPPRVRAAATTRRGGVSAAPYDSLNLSLRGGDDPGRVEANRRRLQAAAGMPSAPLWLEQVHGGAAIDAGAAGGTEPRADAAWTDRPGLVVGVLSADCLPLLLCSREGSWVAAVHGGWRGLAAGVVEAAVVAWPGPRSELLAWLGPAIGPGAYEVGGDVFAALAGADPPARECFAPVRPGHWCLNLYALARLRLTRLGVSAVYGGDRCTYTEAAEFYSYRRDGRCGRMLTFVWLDRSR